MNTYHLQDINHICKKCGKEFTTKSIYSMMCSECSLILIQNVLNKMDKTNAN